MMPLTNLAAANRRLLGGLAISLFFAVTAVVRSQTSVDLASSEATDDPAGVAAVTSTWNTGSGNWGVNANWSNAPATGGFPNNGNAGVATYDAVLANAGTITLDRNITIERFTLSSGTVTGGFSLTMNDSFAWSGGTMEGGGVTNANGGLSLMGAGARSLTGFRTLNNAAGRSAIFGGAGAILTLSGGATFNNNGTLLAQNEGGFANGGGPGILNNAGTLTRNTSAGTFVIGHRGIFTNSGTVNVETGTLDLKTTDGGNASGDFNVSAGAILRFSSGFDLATTSDVAGAGNIEFSNGAGTVNVGGTYNITGTSTFNSGTVNFNSPITNLGSGPLNISGAVVNFGSNDLTFPAINLSSGTLSGKVTSTGLLTWDRGTMKGVINANGGLSVTGSTFRTLFGSTLNLPAGQTAVMNGGTIDLNEGAKFNNSGTFIAQSGGFNNSMGAGQQFNNKGMLKSTGGFGFVFAAGGFFSNTGTVRVEAGNLSFGTSYLQSAGALELAGGSVSSFTFPMSITGGSVQGNGTISASVSNGGTISPGFSSGLINISGSLTLNGSSKLVFEIGGVTPGTQYDRLAVTGSAAIAGGLSVTAINNFDPANTDTFDILTANSRTGTFTNVALPALAGRRKFTLSYGAQMVRLSVATALIGTYEEWKTSRFTLQEQADPLVSGPLADPDRDGQPNRLEYFSGTEPLSVSSRASQAIALLSDGNELFLHLTFPQAQGVTDGVISPSFARFSTFPTLGLMPCLPRSAGFKVMVWIW